MWPWGRRKRERQEAHARAEAALRDAAAGFYELEVFSRRTVFVRDELLRLLDEQIGCSRESFGWVLDSVKTHSASLDQHFGSYLGSLDTWPPLGRHTTEDLDAVTELFRVYAEGFAENLAAAREAEETFEDLFDSIAQFRTECRPLRRALREAEGELERLADGRTSAKSRTDVASRGRRLHAEAEDIRRRTRGARPRLEFLDRTVPAEAVVGP